MKENLIFNSIISLAIVVLVIVNYFKHSKNEKVIKIIHNLSFIAIIYAIILIFSLFWLFDILLFSSQDYLVIYTLVIVIQSIIFFKIYYLFSGNNNLYYILTVYFLGFFSIFARTYNFLFLIIIISFLLHLIIFVMFSYRADEYKKIGYLGIFYSLLSIIFSVIVMNNLTEIYFFSVIINVVFFILLYYFFKDLNLYPPIYKKYKQYNASMYFFKFLRYFIFVVVLTNFVFIGTIGVHELGHYVMSKVYDCESSRIVYENDFPRTEVMCTNLESNKNLVVGGFIFPFILAIFLFSLGGSFLKDISLEIIGFNFIISYHDFLELGLTDNLIMGAMILGIIFVVMGIMYLAKSITEDYTHLIFQ